jgi:urease accessory protein
VVVDQFHAGALRILRAHYAEGSGRPTLTAINPGGAYLGGDEYAVRVELEHGASALLTTQSATKVYRTPQGPARAVQRIDLGPGARFELVPDPLIAYRGARYLQDTEVDMAADASIALAETVTQGWSPDGEPFQFDEVSLVTRVRIEGRLGVVDNLLLRPGDGGVGPLALGGRSHLASLLVVDRRADDGVLAALRLMLAEAFPAGHGAPLVGVTRLAVPGFALRALCDSTGSAHAVLYAAINWLRTEWHAEPALDLRKL